MAKQRYINTKFWSDTWIQKLDPIEKLLFLYLLTNDKTNIAGIYELPIKIMAVETGIEEDTILTIFKRFKKNKKAYFIEGWIIIPNFPKHQDYKVKPKIKTGIELILKQIPDNIRYSIDTLSIPYTYPLNYSNTNNNTNTNIISTKVDRKIPASYGNEDINKITTFLKEKLGGSPDGSQKQNRRFAFLLLNKFKKDYPDKNPVDSIKFLIEVGLKDDFHAKNITSFKYLYYNTQKIVQSAKGQFNNPKYIKL